MFSAMEITKEQVEFQISTGKQYAKLLVFYYKKELEEGLPHNLIIQKIKRDFGVDINYFAWTSAVARVSKKEKPIQHPDEYHKGANLPSEDNYTASEKRPDNPLPDAEDFKRKQIRQNEESKKDAPNPFNI